MKEIILTDKAPRSKSPLSQAVIAGNLIFLSGQGPLHPETKEILGKDVAEQTEYTLINIKNILESAGSSLDKVIKVNAYLADIDKFSEFNNVCKKFFKAPYPARTTIACSLVLSLKVEIDIIAEK